MKCDNGHPPAHLDGYLLNPPEQYADDRNLRARQRLWACQVPFFDIADWVLDLARVMPGMRVLDAGCGNGMYLRALRERQVNAVGCDLSPGMLRRARHAALVNADVTALPALPGAFDVVLAAHLLDLIPERRTAIGELRRVLAPGRTCIAVTNGAQHLRSLRELIERAVWASTPGWRMRARPGVRLSRTSRSRSKPPSTPTANSTPPATWPPSSAGNTSGAAKLPCLVASMPNSMPGMMSGMVIS
jgi:SAM-dependent methyltransferase